MKSLRSAVIDLHLDRKNNLDTVKALKALKIDRMFVKRTIDRYKEAKSDQDRPRSG